MAACEPSEFDPRPGCLRRDWATAAFNLAALYAAQGRNPEATAVAKRIGKSYDGLPINEDTIDEIVKLRELYTDLGQNVKAEALLRRMLAARGALPADDPALAKAEVTLAGLYEGQGRWGELEALYLKAIAVFKGHGDKRSEAGVLARLAAVYEEEGKGPEAAAARRQAEALMAQGGKS